MAEEKKIIVTKENLRQTFKLIKDNFVVKEAGKGLSSEDYTLAEKRKLSGIESKAQENVIEAINVNGVAAEIDGKTANIVLPEASKENIVDALGFTPLSEDEIDSKIATAVENVDTLKRVVVEELPPVEEADLNTIYMVRSTEPSEGNYFVEWFVNEGEWEIWGDTKCDLKDYVTNEKLETNTNEVLEAVSTNYVKNNDVETIIHETVNTEAVTNTIVKNLPTATDDEINALFFEVLTTDTVVVKPDGSKVHFDTVEEALVAAETGETVVLNQNVELTEALEIADGVVIDLNGYTLEIKEAEQQ